MKFSIPSPFSIALGLTAIVFTLALVFTIPDNLSTIGHLTNLSEFWFNSFWSFNDFTMHMVMILVLGHMLALSPMVNRFVFWFISLFNNMAVATASVAFATLVVSFINWGLGLVFGAVLARLLGEYAQAHKKELNYALVGAAGFCGLMVWHGGLSGSAPLTVAKDGHGLVDQIGVIPISETVFSNENLILSLVILILVPLFFFFSAKRVKTENIKDYKLQLKTENSPLNTLKTKRVNILLMVFGLGMLIIAFAQFIKSYQSTGNLSSALNLSFVNFVLYGTTLLFLGNAKRFDWALNDAILSATGILVQFPLYAGIMGVMKESGLMVMMAEGFISISNENSFGLFTYLSAASVNLFVPSGGGQWLVQGEVVVSAAQALNVPVSKSIMALCYGDQLTNMIQPFWALPLLGITKIPAKKILPHTFKLMLLGLIVYGIAIVLW
ncbi:MAG: short-chain fatty acid transporter [Bacteroidetes bacterium]|nr:short-chain fatty acid transporter [Bacteroidota bacterium]